MALSRQRRDNRGILAFKLQCVLTRIAKKTQRGIAEDTKLKFQTR